MSPPNISRIRDAFAQRNDAPEAFAEELRWATYQARQILEEPKLLLQLSREERESIKWLAALSEGVGLGNPELKSVGSMIDAQDLEPQ